MPSKLSYINCTNIKLILHRRESIVSWEYHHANTIVIPSTRSEKIGIVRKYSIVIPSTRSEKIGIVRKYSPTKNYERNRFDRRTWFRNER
ncbi:hypothetical protein QE152_g4256 [Popillia japonica]|uniref:Uncharacterized protein n=1 Tax=Popillia japonica TaxID=7064 RepID=A0AAW1N158_POPJA